MIGTRRYGGDIWEWVVHVGWVETARVAASEIHHTFLAIQQLELIGQLYSLRMEYAFDWERIGRHGVGIKDDLLEIVEHFREQILNILVGNPEVWIGVDF